MTLDKEALVVVVLAVAFLTIGGGIIGLMKAPPSVDFKWWHIALAFAVVDAIGLYMVGVAAFVRWLLG